MTERLNLTELRMLESYHLQSYKYLNKIESFSKDRAGSLLPIRLFIHRTKPPWDYGLVGGGDENPPRDIFVLS